MWDLNPIPSSPLVDPLLRLHCRSSNPSFQVLILARQDYCYQPPRHSLCPASPLQSNLALSELLPLFATQPKPCTDFWLPTVHGPGFLKPGSRFPKTQGSPWSACPSTFPATSPYIRLQKHSWDAFRALDILGCPTVLPLSSPLFLELSSHSSSPG